MESLKEINFKVFMIMERSGSFNKEAMIKLKINKETLETNLQIIDNNQAISEDWYNSKKKIKIFQLKKKLKTN